MKKPPTTKNSKIRIGLVIPHIFMQRDVLPHVIFSPGQLALELAAGLQKLGAEVTMFTPGPVDTDAKNVIADMSYFKHELSIRGDSFIDLLKKHPFTFITLARQVQSELIAKAYAMANAGDLDIVHIYTSEEDIALPFAQFCKKPVVFTHHDPFNFLVKYKNVFPKYKNLNWISMSYAQRKGMPDDTNWVANIYHGLDPIKFKPAVNPSNDYVAYIGRIIQPKGLHLAIHAVKQFNRSTKIPLKLKIAGKHYSGKKDNYWQNHIVPLLDDTNIEYVGFVDAGSKNDFLANAKAVIVPSLFAEPFGMTAIEALASGTPVIALDSGALPEIIKSGINGFICEKVLNKVGHVIENSTSKAISEMLLRVDSIDRNDCRKEFENHFTLELMCTNHLSIYQKLHDD